MGSTSYSSTNFPEGGSSSRPPLYTGVDYTYWKPRMLTYLLAVDPKSFLVITRGPKIPMKLNSNGEEVPKHHSEWTKEEVLESSINAKALNHLYCAIDRGQINKLPEFNNAYELWKSLETINEGTSQIKESKINRYMCDLDNFKMEAGEEIEVMISRFTMIVNQLSSLGKSISMSDQVKKILRSLPKDYRICTSSIRESKDINKLQLDDLVGKLLEFEMDLKRDLKEEEEGKRRKNLALKTSAKINDSEDSSDNEESEDDELALLTRNFKRLLKLKKLNKGKMRRDGKKEEEKPWKSKKEQITCFECKKPGHKIVDCPLKKLKNKYKKKAMKATWSDDESSSSDEEDANEVNNLAFMAMEDDDLLDETDNEQVSNSIDFDELNETFNELHGLYDILRKKHKLLQKEHSSLLLDHASSLEKNKMYEKNITCLKEENIKLGKMTVLDAPNVCECESLKEENVELNKKIIDMHAIITKFTLGEKNFKMLLGSQRCVFDKGGLGYKPHIKQKYLKNYFVKKSTSHMHTSHDINEICHACNRKGHKIYDCIYKKGMDNAKWVPKGTKANTQGPKKIWVPKSK